MVSPPKPQSSPKNDQKKHNKRKQQQQQQNGPGFSRVGPAGRNLLSGLSGAELAMIKKLAGNDPLERKKTMRKLKMWLTGLCKKTTIDSPNDAREQLEPNFIRVWKALFYCMWMADKPLPQEQLAEQISNLVQIFTEKPQVMLLFVEWFFKTMAREWAWIDRFRLDKFMLLVRRFLRKTFKSLDQHKWRKIILDEFLQLLNNQVFNGDQQNQIIKTPLGFQIHMTDIYLEELSKIDSEHLNSKKVLKIISPFIKQMTFNDDERILGEINEKIFNYLLKQSDVGIEYQESLVDMSNGFDEEEESEEENLDENEEMDMEGDDNENIDEEIDENLEDNEQEELIAEDGPLDPRAGAVDVILPQLDVDYELLAEKLETIAKNPDIKRKNRKMLMACSRGFKDLVGGIYPLAAPEEIVQKRAIQKSELKKATKRLLDVEEDLYMDSKKKRTKLEKKMFKKAAEIAGSCNIFSSYEKDKEEEDLQKIDKEAENVVENEEKRSKPGNKKKKRKDKENRNSPGNKMTNGISNVSPKKEKSKKSISPSASTSATTTSTTTTTPLNNITPQKKKKKKNSSSPSNTSLNNINENSGKNSKRMSLPAISSSIDIQGTSNNCKKMNKSVSSSPNSSAAVVSNGDVEIILRSKLKRKVKKSSMSPYKNSPSPIKTPSPSSSGPAIKKAKFVMRTPVSNMQKREKKVSINLHKNTEHEHADYKQSIQRSPQIPFDARKRPISAGLLKSPMMAGLSPLVRKRPLASEFF